MRFKSPPGRGQQELPKFQHPPGVTRVRDREGSVWTRGATRWSKDGKEWVRWYWLTEQRGPLEAIKG